MLRSSGLEKRIICQNDELSFISLFQIWFSLIHQSPFHSECCSGVWELFFFGLSSVLASFHFGNFFLVVCSLLLKGKVKVLSYLKGNFWDKIVRSRLYTCILQRSLFLLEKKRSQFSLLPNSIFTGRPSILNLQIEPSRYTVDFWIEIKVTSVTKGSKLHSLRYL